LDEEEKLRLKIEEWKKQQEAELLQKVTNKIGPSAILFEESEYMNAIFSKVERFLLSPDTRLEIENSSRYQRKLMFEHLRYRFVLFLENIITKKVKGYSHKRESIFNKL